MKGLSNRVNFQNMKASERLTEKIHILIILGCHSLRGIDKEVPTSIVIDLQITSPSPSPSSFNETVTGHLKR